MKKMVMVITMIMIMAVGATSAFAGDFVKMYDDGSIVAYLEKYDAWITLRNLEMVDEDTQIWDVFLVDVETKTVTAIWRDQEVSVSSPDETIGKLIESMDSEKEEP